MNGQPARTDPTVRKLERDVGALTSLDPYVRNSAASVQTVPLTTALADPVEEKALHMVNADPTRTPTFTMFGNPDFFFTDVESVHGRRPSASLPGFAWNHGDIQDEIGNTWVGFVGPGVQHERRRLDDLDRSHERPADDPVAARPEGRLRRRRTRARRRAELRRRRRGR